jgi:hypothetical protein
MKKIRKHMFPIFFALMVFPNLSEGQKNIAGAGIHELGVGIGALNYTGELSPGFNLTFFRPGGMLFYRHNFSPVVSLRVSLLGGSLFADESKLNEPIAQARNKNFSSGIIELGTTVEYNFFNYRPKKEQYRYTPYLTTGIAVYKTQLSGGGGIALPMGVGLKYRVNKRINLGLELLARKTFTDKIDGIDSAMVGVHQTASINEKDWYYYAGFSISWTSYSVVCPEGYNQ